MKSYLKLRAVKSLTCLLQSRLPHNPSRTGLTYEPLVTVLHCARVRVDTLLSCLLQPCLLYHIWQVLSRDFSFFQIAVNSNVCPAPAPSYPGRRLFKRTYGDKRYPIADSGKKRVFDLQLFENQLSGSVISDASDLVTDSHGRSLTGKDI